MSKFISIVTPCYNEEHNIQLLYSKTKAQMELQAGIEYEHIFIDNCSTDSTVAILKSLAASDKHVKIIINSRNFGHIRSPFYGLLQAKGDAVILLVADLQDPPEMLPLLIHEWQNGFPIAVGIKTGSDESPLFYFIRKLYYKILHNVSEIPIIENFTGFGIYDKVVIDSLRNLNDPYPFFRGLICELGYDKKLIPYHQPKRTRGLTKNNLYTLYDIGMLGITSHSKKPLRLIIMMSLFLGAVSFLLSVFYLVYKLIYWNQFSLGMAPVVLGLFFFSAVQIFFLGIIGEYIGNIYVKNMNRPLVIEKERVNF
jgi:glycosyltransferase involved in cell wall biosynthesis